MAWRETGDLDRSAAVTLGGDGGGQIEFSVQHANQKWICDSVVLTSSQGDTQEPYPSVSVHDGAAASDAHRTGNSWVGNKDVISGLYTLDVGTDLFVQFYGGIPGTICTARITGKTYLWT